MNLSLDEYIARNAPMQAAIVDAKFRSNFSQRYHNSDEFVGESRENTSEKIAMDSASEVNADDNHVSLNKNLNGNDAIDQKKYFEDAYLGLDLSDEAEFDEWYKQLNTTLTTESSATNKKNKANSCSDEIKNVNSCRNSKKVPTQGVFNETSKSNQAAVRLRRFDVTNQGGSNGARFSEPNSSQQQVKLVLKRKWSANEAPQKNSDSKEDKNGKHHVDASNTCSNSKQPGFDLRSLINKSQKNERKDFHGSQAPQPNVANKNASNKNNNKRKLTQRSDNRKWSAHKYASYPKNCLNTQSGNRKIFRNNLSPWADNNTDIPLQYNQNVSRNLGANFNSGCSHIYDVSKCMNACQINNCNRNAIAGPNMNMNVLGLPSSSTSPYNALGCNGTVTAHTLPMNYALACSAGSNIASHICGYNNNNNFGNLSHFANRWCTNGSQCENSINTRMFNVNSSHNGCSTSNSNIQREALGLGFNGQQLINPLITNMQNFPNDNGSGIVGVNNIVSALGLNQEEINCLPTAMFWANLIKKSVNMQFSLCRNQVHNSNSVTQLEEI